MIALIVGFIAVEGSGSGVSPKWEITLFYLVFVTAMMVAVLRHAKARLIVTLIALGLLIPLSLSRYYVIVAFFLVTIIHVLIFTAAFVLYGALKGRSFSGILSLAVFLLCAVSLLVYAPAGHAAGNYVQQSYRSFSGLNLELLKLFRFGIGIGRQRRLSISGRPDDHEADCVRLHLSLSELVFQNLDHQVA